MAASACLPGKNFSFVLGRALPGSLATPGPATGAGALTWGVARDTGGETDKSRQKMGRTVKIRLFKNALLVLVVFLVGSITTYTFLAFQVSHCREEFSAYDSAAAETDAAAALSVTPREVAEEGMGSAGSFGTGIRGREAGNATFPAYGSF